MYLEQYFGIELLKILHRQGHLQMPLLISGELHSINNFGGSYEYYFDGQQYQVASQLGTSLKSVMKKIDEQFNALINIFFSI